MYYIQLTLAWKDFWKHLQAPGLEASCLESTCRGHLRVMIFLRWESGMCFHFYLSYLAEQYFLLICGIKVGSFFSKRDIRYYLFESSEI